MSLHIVKLSVGTDSIDDLQRWQRARLLSRTVPGGPPPRLWHTTFQTPKRASEVLDGGSMYWVIRGVIQARQRLIGFDVGQKDDGSPCCLLVLDPDLIPVRPTPRRPFQGWRYLTADDAPPDLSDRNGRDETAEMPPQMRRELATLGLL